MANNTPILYITFARSEYARKTFDAIKLAKPKRLYFYSNKARINNIEEIRNNNEIRSYIDEIDWPCKLETFFRDEYVDIYTSLFLRSLLNIHRSYLISQRSMLTS